MLAMRSRFHRQQTHSIAICLFAILVAGCVETVKKVPVAESPSPQIEDTVKIERLPGANLAAVPLLMLSLDGAPPHVTAALVSELQKQAAARQIVLSDAKTAKYLARGYFSAVSQGENTEFIYVWDVADADRHETHRLTDAVLVKGLAANAWSLFSTQTAAELAAKSADDLAAILSHMPEAKARAKS